ncbi:unnamed protein product [Gordionus sp. m RMFG-2023]
MRLGNFVATYLGHQAEDRLVMEKARPFKDYSKLINKVSDSDSDTYYSTKSSLDTIENELSIFVNQTSHPAGQNGNLNTLIPDNSLSPPINPLKISNFFPDYNYTNHSLNHHINQTDFIEKIDLPKLKDNILTSAKENNITYDRPHGG